MRRELYLASLVLLLTSGTMAYGQQDKMPGMQMQPLRQAASQAEDLPIPDLLAETKTAAVMKLDYLENMALQTNPTLRQAQAVARTSASPGANATGRRATSREALPGVKQRQNRRQLYASMVQVVAREPHMSV